MFKIHVGVDFGTYGSGLAYALDDGKVYIHNTWKDVQPTEKPKTSVLFDKDDDVICVGSEALRSYMNNKKKKV